MSFSLSQKTNAGFLTAMLLMLAVGMQAYLATQSFIDAVQARSQSRLRVRAAMEVMLSLQDAELGSGGTLQPHQGARLNRNFSELKQLYGGIGEVQPLLDDMQLLAHNKMQELARSAALASNDQGGK
ncbi:MAG: hypothetical protein EOO40_03090, partial [Deltaproteobacteria bacterium]